MTVECQRERADGPREAFRLARSTRKRDVWRGGRDRESQLIGKASRDDRGRSTAVYEGAAAGPIEQHGYGLVVGTCSVAYERAVLDVLCLEATTTRRACPPEGGVVLR